MAMRYDPTTGLDSTSERVHELLTEEMNRSDNYRRLHLEMVPVSRDDRNPRFTLKSATSVYLGQIDETTATETDAVLRQIIQKHLEAAIES